MKKRSRKQTKKTGASRPTKIAEGNDRRSFQEAAAVLLGLDENAPTSKILGAIAHVSGALMRATTPDHRETRPWPSPDMRKRAVDALARSWCHEKDSKVEVHEVRGMVTVFIEEGPCVVCPKDEWSDAVYGMSREAAKAKMQTESDSGLRTRLLGDAVAWPVPADMVADMIGKVLARGENGAATIVADEEGIVYAVTQEYGHAMTVRQVGVMVDGRPEPRLTTMGDTTDMIPAFDDAGALMKGAA